MKKSRLIHGAGINDADYAVKLFVNFDGKQKLVWACHFYETWKGMLKRCYSAKAQAKSPTYAGCTVAPEWLRFSNFRTWMAANPWEGNELDKDILHPGNTVYSPEACVFVSKALNLFMLDSGATRGEWPIGVCWHKNSGKLQAKCCNPFTGRREHLGYFDCPEVAHEAWKNRKHELACMYADQQTDPRIANALRNRYAGKPE